MSIGLVFGLLFIIVAAVGIVMITVTTIKFAKNGKLAYADKTETSKNKLTRTLGIVILSIAVIALVIIPPSWHTIEAGEIAVVKHLGEARDTRTAGTYFDFWLTETYEVYDSKVQNMEIVTQAYSKDAQTMDIVMNVQYRIDTQKAIQIANEYGSISLLAERLNSVATEKTKATLSSYSAMNIIETRSTISPEVESVIKKAVDEEYCVEIVAVVLTNIDFSDAFEKTVEDKMIAEQEKLKAEYEKETALVNAQKELEVAKLDAQAKIERAKADAEAQIQVAKAEAKAISLRSIEVARALGFNITETEVRDTDGNLTDIEYEIDFTGKSAEEVKLITDYLKYTEYLAKWDGKLPTVMTGDSASLMIPVDPSTGTTTP